MLAGGERDRLPRRPGRPAVRVAADRRLLLPAALRQSPGDYYGVERAAVPDPLPGDAKLCAAGRRPRRRAPDPAVPSLPRRAGRPLRDHARSARRAAGLGRRWRNLVCTLPRRGLAGPRTPRGVRQRTQARPYRGVKGHYEFGRAGAAYDASGGGPVEPRTTSRAGRRFLSCVSSSQNCATSRRPANPPFSAWPWWTVVRGGVDVA